jgi:hypothetical protein
MSGIITCKDARALGLKHYFTGKQCKHGHTAERIVCNGACVACSLLYQPAYSRARYGRSLAKLGLPPPRVPGYCDLCEKANGKLVPDHDHNLEELGFSRAECHRGWLCFHCNTGLGKLGDTAQALQKALDYVRGI